jgi:hypothetical protein
MKKLVVVAAVSMAIAFVVGRMSVQVPANAEGRGEQGAGAWTPKGNGDVNGDGAIDISDAVYTLTWLFMGGKAPEVIDCPPPRGGALPATGQTICLNYSYPPPIPCDDAEFPGQDGFYHAGCPSQGRFMDNGDGTITDNCTGLMWQKDTADVSGNGLIGDSEEDGLFWPDALKYCESLNFAGHTDWRLPNVRELQSIVDYGRWDPAIDPVFTAVSDDYWSSSSDLSESDDSLNPWRVRFDAGYVDSWGVTGDHFIRAVRNAP